MKKLAILLSESFTKLRKKDLLDNLTYWLDLRSIEYTIYNHGSISSIDSDKYFALYSPLIGYGNSYEDLLKTPKSLPIIFDLATAVDLDKNIFQGRRIAIRNAFGQKVLPLKPEQVTPMLPRPIKPKNKIIKDVIVFDTKQFHSADTHFYILSLLTHVAKEWEMMEKVCGHKLYIYFTSFMKLESYINVYESVIKETQFSNVNDNLLKKFASAMIEPKESMLEYQEILHRTRLFITEHGDMADTDLSQALVLGLPVLTYKRFPFAKSTGIQHSRVEALKLLDPDVEKRISQYNQLRPKEEWGLRRIIELDALPKWDFDAYESMYLKTWDTLYDWAVNKKTDDALTQAMEGGYWNVGVTSDKLEFERVKQSISELSLK